MDELTRVIVIGASAGGHSALIEILRDIPADINAAFIAVLHTAPEAPTVWYSEYLNKQLNLRVEIAAHGMEIEQGVLYVPQPDYHLLVEENTLFLNKGPKENRFRPAIDPLFRSSAVNQGNKTIGVLLTGRLNDGTSGMVALKNSGAYTIVQDPETAEFPDMPNLAKELVKPDYCLALNEISAQLIKLVKNPLPPLKRLSPSVMRELNITKRIGSHAKLIDNKIGEGTTLSCPDCGGPLWKMQGDKVSRYRCHVGHGFTDQALAESQDLAMEEALWVALRTLEEKLLLQSKICNDYKARGHEKMFENYSEKVNDTAKHIQKLKSILKLSE